MTSGEWWLTDAIVFDPATGTVSDPTAIVVSDGVVQHIGATPGHSPSEPRVVDAGLRVVMPGLVDAHAHLTTVEAAHRALRTGVTTVRSAGVEGFHDVGLRILSRRRPELVPNVHPAGLVVAPSLTDSRDLLLTDPTLAALMGPSHLTLRDLAEPVVSVNASHGAMAIKTHATERAGLVSAEPDQVVCDLDELAHVVEVARRHGLPVMCHAHGAAGCRLAAEAGVRSIEHGTFADTPTLELMAERGIWLVPTLSVLHDMAFGGGEYTDARLRERGKRMFDAACDTVQRAVAAGVRIATGTDTRYSENSRSSVAGEIQLLVDAGVSVDAALFAATGAASDLMEGDCAASISVGNDANMVVLDGDPRTDLSQLSDPWMVIHRGRVVQRATS